MEIIEKSRDFTKQEIYKLTHNQSVSLKDAIGEVFTVNGYLYYSDTNYRGESIVVLVLETVQGFVSTISETFRNSFMEIVDAFPLPVDIEVIGGKTKSGRDFINCQLA